MDKKKGQVVIDLDDKVTPVILATIFDMNVSLVYQESQKGRLPNPITDYTYRDCIPQYLNYFKKAQDLKIEKERNATRLKEAKLEKDLEFKDRQLRAKIELEERALKEKPRKIDVSDDGMPPLIAAKTKQDIRLGRAREQQLWVKAAIERGEYLAIPEVTNLVEPFIMAIRQSLLSIASENEIVEKQVDQIMENLHRLGTVLVEQAEFDSDNFITKIMEKEIDIDEIDAEGLPDPVL